MGLPQNAGTAVRCLSADRVPSLLSVVGTGFLWTNQNETVLHFGVLASYPTTAQDLSQLFKAFLFPFKATRKSLQKDTLRLPREGAIKVE